MILSLQCTYTPRISSVRAFNTLVFPEPAGATYFILDLGRYADEREFVHGADIADTRVLDTLLRSLHLDSERLLSRIAQPDTKARLQQRTAEAQQRGVFGAPSFICGGELFGGDDRLEQALAWAARP